MARARKFPPTPTPELTPIAPPRGGNPRRTKAAAPGTTETTNGIAAAPLPTYRDSVGAMPEPLLGLRHNTILWQGFPPVPHSTRLLIVRSPGGYTLFESDTCDMDQADADPARAIAVASTPAQLMDRARAWADALPPATDTAAIP